MIFIFLGALATIAVGSIIYAVYKILQDSKLIRKLEVQRENEKIELIREISTCVKNLQDDNNSQTLKTLQEAIEYFQKYY